MILLFCFATEIESLHGGKLILWPREITHLSKKLEFLTAEQIIWITANGFRKDNKERFNEIFKCALTWKQMKEFRCVMEWALTDLLLNQKRSLTTLPLTHEWYGYFERMKLLPDHPLYERYYEPLIRYLKNSN